jgi:Nuclease-related domain
MVGARWAIRTAVALRLAMPFDGDFFVGAWLGIVVCFTAVVPSLAPSHIQNWELGAWGEQSTAKALRKLPKKDWHVVHDRAGRHGNIDHVLVGPPGVVLLDSKWLVGKTTLEGDRLRLRRLEDPADGYHLDRLVPQLKGAAAFLRDRIREAGARPGWIEAAAVMWGGLEPSPLIHEHVTLVKGDDLVAWLTTLPPKLDVSQIDVLAAAIRSLDAAPMSAVPTPA